MGEQTGKIVKTIVITLVVLALIAGGVIYAIVNSSENLILGTWESSNDSGYNVKIEFTDLYENPSTKETICHITFKHPDGPVEMEKATYNISNGKVVTFRPADESKKGSATTEFKIDGKKLICVYEMNYQEKEITFAKTGKYVKENYLNENLILGTWEGTMDGKTVKYEFTDVLEKPEDKDAVCNVTTIDAAGNSKTQKNKYKIASDATVTLRPSDKKFKMDGKKLIFTQEGKDEEGKDIKIETVFIKTADYEKKDK